MKKYLSVALAIVMVFSLAVPTLAEGNTTSSQSQNVAITGTTKSPTINVTVPNSGDVVLNPYQMSVTVDSEEVTDQIISATQYLKNETDTAVKVTASVTGSLGTDSAAVFSAKDLKDDTKTTTKSVYLVFEMIKNDEEDEPESWTGASTAVVKKGTAAASDAIELEAGNTTANYIAFHLTGNAVKNPTTAWTGADTVNVAIAFTITPTVIAPSSGS